MPVMQNSSPSELVSPLDVRKDKKNPLGLIWRFSLRASWKLSLGSRGIEVGHKANGARGDVG